MPFPLSVMPDDELAVLQYLRGIPEVVALIPSDRITTEMPPSPVYPLALVQRAGGQGIWPALDEPAVQVDIFGGTKAQCKRAMQTFRAAILAIANDVVPEAVLSSAYEEVGPQWLPDTIPVPPVPRYTARFRILLHK